MKVALPYGKSTLKVDVPDENVMKVGFTLELKAVKNVRAKIIESLRKPVGTQPLSSLVGRGKRIAVIAADYTRPCPDNVLLPPILEEL
ncbi:MAG: lactate racemase domain-containing protein, partial [Candidatus Bathyarchaeota archaeon]|nr:lactate racemase domain-containing protein [Candidatus Bathyarchaeota archaeon]